MKRKQTYELLLPIINAIDKSISVDSIVDNLDGTFTLFTCDTGWATTSTIRNVVIDGNYYFIVGILPDAWIKVQGTVLPDVTEFDLYSPFPFHGTVIAQRELLNEIKHSSDKMPMVWLHEITREDFENNSLTAIDRKSECDLYFLVDADWQNWLTLDHDRYAIRPMRNLIDRFMAVLEDSTLIENDNGLPFTIYDHAKFGEYLESKGHTNLVFADKLSGSQLRINIPFLKESDCTC